MAYLQIKRVIHVALVHYITRFVRIYTIIFIFVHTWRILVFFLFYLLTNVGWWYTLALAMAEVKQIFDILYDVVHYKMNKHANELNIKNALFDSVVKTVNDIQLEIENSEICSFLRSDFDVLVDHNRLCRLLQHAEEQEKLLGIPQFSKKVCNDARHALAFFKLYHKVMRAGQYKQLRRAELALEHSIAKLEIMMYALEARQVYALNATLLLWIWEQEAQCRQVYVRRHKLRAATNFDNTRTQDISDFVRFLASDHELFKKACANVHTYLAWQEQNIKQKR